MSILSPTQIKAARAGLDWTRKELADRAKLSETSVKNLENGKISYKSLEAIKEVFEEEGWEFFDNDGMRRRSNDIRILDGADGADVLYKDILNTLKNRDPELSILVESQDLLLKSLGLSQRNNQGRLKSLGIYGRVRCLLSQERAQPTDIATIQFRNISPIFAGPISYLIYGNKYAIIQIIPEKGIRFVVFQSLDISLSYKTYYNKLWENTSFSQSVRPEPTLAQSCL